MALIIIASTLLVFPQYHLKGFIIGSDMLFHYNRFYDVSEQIKNNNFQYFISMYGFQQSGRIVNSLYGPVFAYIQGLLVLVSKSWFQYQIISNFILYVVSGISMFILLKKMIANSWLPLGFSLFFMSTYAIQYWINEQGMSAWAAAVFPLCLIPLINLINKNNYSVLGVATSIAVMFQIHILSTMFLVFIYSTFFLYVFIKTKDKKSLVISLIKSVFVFLLLTVNVWGNMISIYSSNQLVAPFINQYMENNTITAGSSYWFSTPLILPFLLAIYVCGVIIIRNTLSPLLKLLTINTLIFVLLSTNFVPWKILSRLNNPILDLIQFPFRFFVPGCILLIISLALLIEKLPDRRIAKPIFLVLLLGISFIQTIYENTENMINWSINEAPISGRAHTYLLTQNKNEVKKSVFYREKKKILEMYQKSTPDYLPIYGDETGSKYNAYGDEVIMQNKKYYKEVKYNKLQLSWQGKTNSWITLPVIKYKSSVFILNGKHLSDSEIKTSMIGGVSLKEKEGWNNLILSYKEPQFFWPSLVISFLGWIWVSFRQIKSFYLIKRKKV
ncbi:hypothetical protein MXL84_06705 [Enterococcus gallinarum]|uniref:hypothetical protein n=1 Tax=Enterococcus gallinarum TaxID=1353 RepID=UPI00115AFAB9|nr:hypothetical protein [Enterococcus gallinarum]MEB5881601.1 hypothetical protein [Enterococcus gallinarum]